MNALGYIRLSQDGASLQAQADEITEYAQEQGYELLKTYSDGTGASGYSQDRDQYQQLLEDIETGEIDAIIARESSRYARSIIDQMRLIVLCDDTDTELHTVDIGRLEDTFASMGMYVLQSINNDYSKRSEIDRAKKAVEQRIENGHYQGRPPRGLQFNAEKTGLEPDEDFEAVLEVLKLYDEGTSKSQIARETQFNRSTVRRIIDRQELYQEVQQ